MHMVNNLNDKISAQYHISQHYSAMTNTVNTSLVTLIQPSVRTIFYIYSQVGSNSRILLKKNCFLRNVLRKLRFYFLPIKVYLFSLYIYICSLRNAL